MKSSEFLGKWKIRLLETIKDRNLAIYLVFVLISFVFFFLHALSKEYTTDLEVKVSYLNFPKDKERVSSDPEDKIVLNVTGHGYSLFWIYLTNLYKTYEVDLNLLEELVVSNSLLVYDQRGYAVRKHLTTQIGSKQIQVNSVAPQKVSFPVRVVSAKKVSIKVASLLNMKSGYMLESGVSILPDSVWVRGEKNIVDTLDVLYTEPLNLENIEGKFQEELSVINKHKKLIDIFLSDEFVMVKGNVVATITQKRKFEITPVNFPDSLAVELYPSNVTLSYVSNQEAIKDLKETEGFRLIVDYNDRNRLGGRLEVQVLHLPENVFNVYISPRYVDYVIKHK